MSTSSFWGVDIGGTTTVIGELDRSGVFGVRCTIPTRPHEGPSRHMAEIAGRIAAHDSSPAAVAVGIAGLVDRATGILHFSPNLPGWGGLDVPKSLPGLEGVPVTVDNDCNAFAYGAVDAGHMPRSGLRILVTLGTGIGGTIVSEGRILYGTGFAGEVGHMPVEAGGPPCPCGSTGCWERYAGRSSLMRYFGGDDAPDPVEMAAMARTGDLRAAGAFETYGRWVGIGLAGLANCLSPHGFHLAGGLAGAFDLFRRPAEAVFRSRCRHEWRVEVVPSSSEAGARGAAAMARDSAPC